MEKQMLGLNEQKIVFELPKKVSTNRIYSGVYYRERQKYKEMYALELSSSFRSLKPVEKCEIDFEFMFGGRLLDCDNCSFMAKMIIDVLRRTGRIQDDTPKFITKISLSSEHSKDSKDYCRMTIRC